MTIRSTTFLAMLAVLGGSGCRRVGPAAAIEAVEPVVGSADLGNPDAVDEVLKTVSTIVACVGPYELYGRHVVASAARK